MPVAVTAVVRPEDMEVEESTQQEWTLASGPKGVETGIVAKNKMVSGNKKIDQEYERETSQRLKKKSRKLR